MSSSVAAPLCCAVTVATALFAAAVTGRSPLALMAAAIAAAMALTAVPLGTVTGTRRPAT